MDLVRRRTAIREYIHAEEAEARRRLLLVCFAAIVHTTRGQALRPQARQTVSAWFRQLDSSVARALQLLHELTTAIRAAVRGETAVAYLDGLKNRITLQDLRQPKALYQAVRAAFPKARSARRRNFTPLPAVQLANGDLAATGRQRRDRCIQYFADQESGSLVTAETYANAFANPDIPVTWDKPVFEVSAVPALRELEQQLLALRLGKATGPDGLTAEAMRLHVAAAARTLYPLCLKASLGTREPVDWRGGSLITLAKRAAAALDCSAFRSSLLAKVAAKVQHRLLRNRLLPAFSQYRPAAQAGQAPGVRVDAIGLIVRAYQVWARQRRRPTAVAFFDLKSAF